MGSQHGLQVAGPRRDLESDQPRPHGQRRSRIAADDGRAGARARALAARRRHVVLHAHDHRRIAARREAALRRQRRRPADGDAGRRTELDQRERADSGTAARHLRQQRAAVAPPRRAASTRRSTATTTTTTAPTSTSATTTARRGDRSRPDLPAASVHRLREHPRNARLLFLGHERGIHFSIDGGASWSPLTLNMPTVPVDDILIHPRDNDLIVGTHGRSIWVLDNISSLEALTPEAMQTDAFLVPPARARLLARLQPAGVVRRRSVLRAEPRRSAPRSTTTCAPARKTRSA